MSFSYPLPLPTVTGFSSFENAPQTIVGIDRSNYTGHQQVYPWAGQWLQFSVVLPAMKEAAARVWMAFFLSLNGPEGTFLLGPSIRKVSAGTIAGSVTVDTGAVAGSTTLPITGGTGSFAVGDWLQVDTGANARLHSVLRVDTGSVEVFPRLRTAYASGTAINYTNPVGVFRMTQLPSESYDSRKICSGMSFTASEAY